MTERYRLEGLHCANCGEKIRAAVAKQGDIRSAQLNMATVVLTVDRKGEGDLSAKIQKICDSIEDGVTVRSLQNNESRHRHDHGAAGGMTVIALSGTAAVLAVIAAVFGLETVSGVLFTLSALTAAAKPAVQGIKGLVRLDIDENLLLCIAAAAAVLIGEYAEAAAVTLLFAVGQQIESAVSRRSRKEIETLSEIRPDRVHTDEGDRPAAEVKIGDIIIVHPGERIPLDGTVISGSGQIDASAITGESIPLTAEYGTPLLGGMLNGAGVLKLKVTGDYNDSAAARILRLVEDSAQRKGTAERFITRFAKIYTPLCVLAAVLINVIPAVILGGFTIDWLQKSLVFLVASCPCALVISVPLAFYSGVGAASRKGVLIKGGVYIEALADTDAVAFDKTGTLTSGNLKVENVYSLDDTDVLAVAAAAEAHSDHPVAAAIRAACSAPARLDGQVTEHAGYGVEVKGGRHILVGASRLMQREGVDTSQLPDGAVYVAIDGVAVGCINVIDRLRDDSPDLIKGLRSRKVGRIAILSGDSPAAVRSAAEGCGIDEVHAALLPEDKVAVMEQIKGSSKAALFVGDGINDAPVIAAATAGVAMGLGTDAAIETADVVLTSGSPSALITAIDISRRTMKTVRFNIALSIGVKLAVMLSAFVYPMMWAAVVADVVLSVVCSLNSARLMAGSKP